MSEMDGIIKEFLVESNENLDQLDRDLIELEKNPTSEPILSGIFRTIHSIKGATGFLGFSKLGTVAHAGESLLSRLRAGALALSPEITSGLLSLVDAIRQMLSEIAETGQEGQSDHSSLIARLGNLQEGPTPVHAGVRGADIPASGMKETNAPVSVGIASQSESAGAKESRSGPDRNDKSPGSPSQGEPGQPPSPAASAQTPKNVHARSIEGGSLRVDVHQLDKLMDLSGELVLVRNQILQICGGRQDPTFTIACQQLNLITSEMQEGVAKSRMQPIKSLWHKLPRLVRDLALQCGKKVRLEMNGEETELDRTLLEAIHDPLTHLIRNAVDHGIETPDARLAAGKPAEGSIVLHAFHENGEVNIDISDDGRGLDLNRIRQKAVDNHLLTPEMARSMDDRKTLELIFLPGFSTAEKVTDVSGRGVGMDVVKTNIEKIGGTIEIQSHPGLGTNMRIRIPLTLAIISALTVSVRGDRFAIPQLNVVELRPLDEMEEKKQIDRIQGVLLCRLRGRILPLVSLDAGLQMETSLKRAAPQGSSNQNQTVIILQARDLQFGLIVDEVQDTEEVVVKPLGKHLRSVPVYAGATILGDGKVALILDVPALARYASVAVEAESAKAVRKDLVEDCADRESNRLLLVEGPNGERYGIPLSQVTRLEEFPHSALETSGSEEALQYRDEILPVVRIPKLPAETRSESQTHSAAPPARENLQVVVCRGKETAFGLVVNRIFDVVEHNIPKLSAPFRSAKTASAVILGRVTRILNLDELDEPRWPLSAPPVEREV